MRRQADRDAKAMALDAIRKFDRAGALLQQRADDREPKAGACRTIDRRNTVEAIEYPLSMLRRNARSIIGDPHGISITNREDADNHGSAVLIVTDRVVDQIGQDVMQH